MCSLLTRVPVLRCQLATSRPEEDDHNDDGDVGDGMDSDDDWDIPSNVVTKPTAPVLSEVCTHIYPYPTRLALLASHYIGLQAASAKSLSLPRPLPLMLLPIPVHVSFAAFTCWHLPHP